MDNEVRELLTPTKTTVGIRFECPKKVHKGAMAIHRDNPRTWNFDDTLIEIMAEGIKAIRARKE